MPGALEIYQPTLSLANPIRGSIGEVPACIWGMIVEVVSLMLEQENRGEAVGDRPAQEEDWGTQRSAVGVLDVGGKQSLGGKTLGSVVRLLGLEFLFLCLTLQLSSHTPPAALHILWSSLFLDSLPYYITAQGYLLQAASLD